MTRRALTPADVDRAIACVAEELWADRHCARGFFASFAVRAAAVEALLMIGAAGEPEVALGLARLGGEADALRVAHAMSDADWDPLLVRKLGTVLKPLLPTSPAARSVARRAPPADVTAAIMGDPTWGRSAAAERRAA